MMSQTMLELSEGWDVITPLGKGVAMIITTPGSYLSNPIVYVRLEGGQMKQFDTNDIVLLGSPTYGEQRVPTKLPWDKQD
jgi:hypothetical protein